MAAQDPMANGENYRIRASVCSVSKFRYNDTNDTANSSSLGSFLIVKAKIKVNLCLLRPGDDHNNNNNNPVVIEEVRTHIYKGTYSFPWDDLTSDNGAPNSTSWALISGMISNISDIIPFRLDRVYWGVSNTPLEDPTTELVSRVLQKARSLAFATEQAQNRGDGSHHLCFSLNKDIFVDHDDFITRVHRIQTLTRSQEILERCVSRLRGPPLDEERVRREIVASFRDGGLANDIPINTLNLLTEWVMRRLGVMESKGIMIPASEEAINGLDSFIFIGEEAEEQLQCVVCRETMVAGEMVTRLPCSHLYHPECAKEWLRKSHYCPLCRYKLPTQ